MEFALSAICELVGGEVVGDCTTRITGISAPESTQTGHLTLAEDARHLALALASDASAILVGAGADGLQGRPGIRLADPKLAFAKLLALYYPEPLPEQGVHPSAVVGADVSLADAVAIGANAVLEDGVTIGRGSRIGAGVYIGHESSIGEDCTIYPNVTVYRRTRILDRVSIHSGTIIGGDGFGYLFHEKTYYKIPQTGDVLIENDVEIGCNVCIDRATVGSTIVREGTKIDNLVQVAHNNEIGRHVVIAGQTGMAGSVSIGDYSRLGGQVGVSDHITIGRGVNVGVGTLVVKSVASGGTVWGVPARPAKAAMRQLSALSRLPALLKRWLGVEGRVQDQAERLSRLEQRLEAIAPGARIE